MEGIVAYSGCGFGTLGSCSIPQIATGLDWGSDSLLRVAGPFLSVRSSSAEDAELCRVPGGDVELCRVPGGDVEL